MHGCSDGVSRTAIDRYQGNVLCIHILYTPVRDLATLVAVFVTLIVTVCLRAIALAIVVVRRRLVVGIILVDFGILVGIFSIPRNGVRIVVLFLRLSRVLVVGRVRVAWSVRGSRRIQIAGSIQVAGRGVWGDRVGRCILFTTGLGAEPAVCTSAVVPMDGRGSRVARGSLCYS